MQKDSAFFGLETKHPAGQGFSIAMNDDFSKLMQLLNRINPPENLQSFEEMEEAINSNYRYSLVQRQFFLKMIDVFYTLKQQQIPGDIAVAGVWKGGSAMFMQALLVFFKLDKRVFLFDTFSPFGTHGIYTEREKPFVALLNAKVPTADKWFTETDIELNFKQFDLPVHNVVFCKGPVEETAIKYTGEAFCLLHTDVDFYTPTFSFLNALYPALQPGGFVFADDYGAEVFDCKKAVDEIRVKFSASNTLCKLTDYIFYWNKA